MKTGKRHEPAFFLNMARPKREETEIIPFRNPDCRFYSFCLTQAATQDNLFSCVSCNRYEFKELDIDEVIDQIGCYANFLYALFQKKHKRQHVMSGNRRDTKSIRKAEAKLKVIEFLKNNGKSNSHAVEKAFGSMAKPYLIELRKEGLIKREKIGSIWLYSAF